MDPDVRNTLLDELAERAPLLNGEGRVLVACSGGPDSVALLALAAHAGHDVVAAYVDHGLRNDSAADFQIVQAAAETVGVKARSVWVAVAEGSNLEARARDARYAALETMRVTEGASAVLVAHTLDDQAETVLMAVLRGSGLAGLAGMPTVRDAIVRPLLGLRRAELRQVCAAFGFATVDDPMNHNAAFLRVWVREQLLPMLSDRTDRDVAPVLARQADLLRADNQFLDQLAADALLAAGSPPRARDLAALPLPLLRRAVRLLVGYPRIGGQTVEAALDVVYGARVAVELPAARTLRRSAGTLRVESTRRPEVA